jgi:hypothetical protein
LYVGAQKRKSRTINKVRKPEKKKKKKGNDRRGSFRSSFFFLFSHRRRSIPSGTKHFSCESLHLQIRFFS